MNARGPIILVILLAMAGAAAAFELKDVRYRTASAGTVVFSHDLHLRQKSIRNNCQVCHPTQNRKIPRATMARMEQGAACGACHNGTKAFALADCTGCHKIRGVQLDAGALGPVVFSHQGHAARQHCPACHNQRYRTGKNPPVGMAAMRAGKSCGACHNANLAFGLERCTACHQVREPVYRISGAGNVRFNHASHLESSSCRDCHQKIFASTGRQRPATMAEMAGGSSCGACHDGKSAFTVKENCARCHSVT